jgi:hypothetical protein
MPCLPNDRAHAGTNGPQTRRRGLLVALAVVAAGCGEPNPGTPPGTRMGGTLSGRYRLELKLASSCSAAAVTATFPVQLAASGSSPHPGIQVTLDGGDPGLLELELKYTDFVLEGAFSTTDDGARSDQAREAWVNAIGRGAVTQTSDGRGQVMSGTLRGYLEIEGTAACTATDSAFTLTPR